MIDIAIVPPYAHAQYGSVSPSLVDQYPRPANGIQTMIYLIFRGNPSSDYNYLAKEMDYVWFDQSSLASELASGAYSFSELFNVISTLHSLNPNIKIGTHAGTPVILGPYHLPYSSLSDTDFLHDSSGNVLHEGNLTYLNLGSATTRQKIAVSWQSIFTSNPGLTGINLDGYVSAHLNAGLQSGCREGACTTQEYWFSGMEALSSALKAALPGKDITYNGLFYTVNPAQVKGPMASGFVDYNDGVLVEWPHEMIVSPAIFSAYLNTIGTVLSKQKKVFFWVQPLILNQSYPSVSWTNDLDLERFYLASYLLIQQNPLTYFGYHPGAIYNGTLGLYFYPDWNRDYGAPSAPYVLQSNGLYTRTYANGIVVVNPTNSTQTFTLPTSANYREWDAVSGTSVSTQTPIASHQGKFYFLAHDNNASCVSTTIPSQMTAGQSVKVSMTFLNTGTRTWKNSPPGTPENFDAILSPWPQPAPYMGPPIIDLPVDSVTPGKSATFDFTLVAPSVPGTYSAKYRLVEQGVEYFGRECGQSVQVVAAATTPVPVAPIASSSNPFVPVPSFPPDPSKTPPPESVPVVPVPSSLPSFSNGLQPFTQAASLNCLNLTYNLKYGSKDELLKGEVSRLQEFLSPKYFSQQPTGFMGNVTLMAVKNFQRLNGISTTGFVGPLTRAKIKSLSCR